MAKSLHIQVFDKQQLLFSDDLTGPIELGRQRQKEQSSYRPIREADRWRLSIARTDEPDVSRRHALIEPLEAGRVRITNLSEVQSISFKDGGEMLPKSPAREMNLPVTILLGGRLIQVDAVEEELEEFQSLGTKSIVPGSAPQGAVPAMSLVSQPDKLDLAEVIGWMQTAVSVLHSAVSSSEFFEKAARAALELVGLDSGQVLLLENDEWKAIASYPPRSESRAASFSRRVLQRVLDEKKTFWQVPAQSGAQQASLLEVRAVVAAPILNRQGAVIGALYGERKTANGVRSAMPISRIEAMLMELLATGVATGLARLEQEKAALTARIQFEQFFTPELAHHLTIEPDLLKGRDAEVTLLFVDIRRFSRHSELLGPARTDQWIGDVMDTLCEPVLATQGVLVDFRGDELIAMWGAPRTQPDHAKLGCRAALQMLQTLPELNRRWQSVLGEPMEFGIGVNSGPARVGNTGSQSKFKYGPHGTTVNLASRVQGATKYMKVRTLITGTTQQALDTTFCTRCLGRVRVVNIAEPVALYELALPGQSNWEPLQAAHQQALGEFERKEFRKVIRTLGNLLVDYPDDGPALVLLSRAVNFLVVEPDKVDTVWELPGK
jgi:adenylate cyclase